MIERESRKVAAQLAIASAALALLPALWSLVSAVWSAVTTGQVLVISVGRTQSTQELVAWQAGWARFAGPPLLVASLFVYTTSKSPQGISWWASAVLSTTGIFLLSFSWWFSTIDRTIDAAVVVALVAMALAFGKRYGRLAAYLFVLVAFSAVLWWLLRNAA